RAEPLTTRTLVEIHQVARVLAAVPESDAIESSEIRGTLGRRDNVIRRYRKRQIRQTHFAQRRTELLVHAERVAYAPLNLGIQALLEELLQQANLQTVQ